MILDLLIQKWLVWLCAVQATTCFALGQSLPLESLAFEDYFQNKALRLELYQCGDARESGDALYLLLRAKGRLWLSADFNSPND